MYEFPFNFDFYTHCKALSYTCALSNTYHESMAFNLQSESLPNYILPLNQINTKLCFLVNIRQDTRVRFCFFCLFVFFSDRFKKSSSELILSRGKFLPLMIHVRVQWNLYTHILSGYLKSNFLASYGIT